MQTTSITELKNSLSAYLRSVKAGEEVLITDRGRPIARLVPVSPSDSIEERMDDLERRGVAQTRDREITGRFLGNATTKGSGGISAKGHLPR